MQGNGCTVLYSSRDRPARHPEMAPITQLPTKGLGYDTVRSIGIIHGTLRYAGLLMRTSRITSLISDMNTSHGPSGIQYRTLRNQPRPKRKPHTPGSFGLGPPSLSYHHLRCKAWNRTGSLHKSDGSGRGGKIGMMFLHSVARSLNRACGWSPLVDRSESVPSGSLARASRFLIERSSGSVFFEGDILS